jgi:hypothetical protein
LLGTNLIDPRRQRFHDDDPAGKFKSGVIVGSGPLFFDGADLFANFVCRPQPRSTTRPAALKAFA